MLQLATAAVVVLVVAAGRADAGPRRRHDLVQRRVREVLAELHVADPHAIARGGARHEHGTPVGEPPDAAPSGGDARNGDQVAHSVHPRRLSRRAVCTQADSRALLPSDGAGGWAAARRPPASRAATAARGRVSSRPRTCARSSAPPPPRDVGSPPPPRKRGPPPAPQRETPRRR